MRQVLSNLGWTCCLLVSLLLLPQVQTAPFYNANTTGGNNATGDNSTGEPITTTTAESTTTADASFLVDLLAAMEDSQSTDEPYAYQHIRERRSADTDCISNTTALGDAMIMATQGKMGCDGYTPPQWLFLSTISKHQENLFMASAICFFAVILCYSFLHFFGGIVAKVFNYLSIVFTMVAYTCTLTMAALHLASVTTTERVTILVFTLIVLFLLTMKLALHIALSFRAKTGRAMSLLCNFVVTPKGGFKGRVAFAGYQTDTPQILLLLSRAIKASDEPGTPGKYEWKMQGQSRIVESVVPQPGSLTVYSFFGSKNLPLRAIQKSTKGFSVCIYTTMPMDDPVKVKSSVARSFSKMTHSNPEQTTALMREWSDEESDP